MKGKLPKITLTQLKELQLNLGAIEEIEKDIKNSQKELVSLTKKSSNILAKIRLTTTTQLD